MSRSGPRRPRRPRSEPQRFGQPQVPRRWKRSRPALRRRGQPWLSTRVRRAIWMWQPWAALAGWFLAVNRFGWAAGMFAVAAVAYALRWNERPPTLGLDHTTAVGTREFLDTMQGLTGIVFLPGNRFDVLENGDAFYPVMLDAIAQAQRSVTMEQYIFWAGATAETFAQALADRARAGVRVKLLLDAVGSATLGDRVLDVLSESGCEVAWYNEIHWYTVGRFNNRNHRKSLIVDGRVGFTGGAGLADHWRGDARSTDEWRDTQVRIEGPGVVGLQKGFASNWLRSTGEVVKGDDFFPHHAAAGAVTMQVINSSPRDGASSARLMYYLAIVSARRCIDIANPYFVPDEIAVETLTEAAGRGVRVRVLMTGIRNDNWLARHNSVGLYGTLLKGGVKLYEYHPTMLHQKVMLVDEGWCTVGTSNFDNRSFAHNEETNVCTCDAGVLETLARTFEDDLAASTDVQLDAWRRRGVSARAQEFVASLLREQV